MKQAGGWFPPACLVFLYADDFSLYVNDFSAAAGNGVLAFKGSDFNFRFFIGLFQITHPPSFGLQ
jgi:hypothetical protein